MLLHHLIILLETISRTKVIITCRDITSHSYYHLPLFHTATTAMPVLCYSVSIRKLTDAVAHVCTHTHIERRSSVVVSTSALHTPIPGLIPCSDQACYIRYKNLALYIRDCVSLCLSDETLKAVGPFCLVSMPGEVKDHTQGVNV